MSNKLILTALSFNQDAKENQIFLGEWCDKNNSRDLNNSKIMVEKHHWTDRTKSSNDFNELESIYENFLKLLSSKLNFYHKLEKDILFWRIVIGPWLYFYVISMFDRWETLRKFFEKYNSAIIERKEEKETIFYNNGTSDFRNKAATNDHWNNANFLRIIDFSYRDKVKFTSSNIDKKTKNKNKSSQNYSPILRIGKKFLINTFFLIDGVLSAYGIKKNNIIIESLNYSKINLFKLFFHCKIFTSFYINTFKEESLKSNFEIYLYQSLITDFPTSYLEDFTRIDNLNNKINFLKNKIIFSAISQTFNERFKIWLARMIEQNAKLFIVAHGGCIPFKINNDLFSHQIKISKKIMTSHKPLGPQETQLSPIYLLKSKNIFNKNAENCLFLACQSLRYPVKLVSWPYVEEYKIWFDDLCSIVSELNPEIANRVVYRCIEDEGFKTSTQFIKKFKQARISHINEISLLKEFKKSRLIVSTYPDTPTAEAIISNIPSVISFSPKLYKLSDDFSEILDDLKKNKIFFESPKLASKHINEVWDNPFEWWKSQSTQSAIEKFKKFTMNIDSDWVDQWKHFLNKASIND